MKIYITGTTGKLGSAVLSKIPDAIPLVRKPGNLPNEVVTDFSVVQLKNTLKDADVVVHVAGSVDTLNPEAMREANVELTRRIVESTPKKAKLIFASSISVYGKKPATIPTDENTKPNPDSEYSKSKYDAEFVVALHQNHVILRIGPVYGPGFEDYFRIMSMLEMEKMRIIGDGSNRIPFVHVEDVADVIKGAIKDGKGIYAITGESRTQKEIYQIACKALNVPEPTKRISRSIALLLATINEFKYKVLYRTGNKRPSMTTEHVSVLSYDRVFECKRAKKELGFSPRTIEAGINEMVERYKMKKAKNPQG